MSRNTLTTIKADARIQRCTIIDPFKNYKLEDEKHIKTFRIEGNKTLKQLKKVFRRSKCNNEYIEQNYMKTLSLIKSIRCSSKDITAFSLALTEFQERENFKEKAGIFLSALINNCSETEFTAITEHLSKLINYLGYMNTKNITVQGDVGDIVGCYMEKGLVTIHGNAEEFVGDGMKGGSITIKGDAGDNVGFGMKGGSITIKGNMGDDAGPYMGDIAALESKYQSLGLAIEGGNIFHKSRQIVKNGKRLI